METSKNDKLRADNVGPIPPERNFAPSITFGVFLIIAGSILLLERLGIIPETQWFFPSLLIAWGCTEVLQRIKS